MTRIEHNVFPTTRHTRTGAVLLRLVRGLAPVAVTMLVLASFIDSAACLADKVKKTAPAPTGEPESAASDRRDEKEKTRAGEPGDVPENPFPRRFKAPDLDGGSGWLNTSGEITLFKTSHGKSRKEMETPWGYAVTEYSESPLDPALFTVPPGFKKMK